MDELLKVMQFIGFFFNILIVPVVVWVIRIEKKMTEISTILGLCDYCPNPKNKKD